MTLPYRRSAGADRCRYPTPDADGRCRRCGWRLDFVTTYDGKSPFAGGYYRHRRPRAPRPVGKYSRTYQHEAGTNLTLSEVAQARCSASAAIRTHGCSYPQRVDITGRTGAGNRLVLPTPDEWAAWKAAIR